MHAPRIHFKEHMHTEKTRLQHQIWPQKRGQFLDLQFAPFPIEGWFWGPLVGPRNGPRNAAFFLLLLPYHLGPNIWPAWPQLQRFSACQSGFTTKGSTCSKCPCTIIIICDQHSYYDCKHTHTQWGPTATKPEMLVFETPKTGLLKVSLRTHNHMLSTQLPQVQAYTHTERGSMDARHGCLQKEASFFGPVAFNVGAARRDIQGNIIHSVWTMIAHVAMEFRRIFLALVWYGSLQCGSVRGYKGMAR